MTLARPIASSILEQYNVAQFIEWYNKKQLTLNPSFQRRNVWTLDGKSYLIDTILRGLPMPKIYMRTIIDVATQQSVREIVDGQQRMRAILDFARGELRLNKRAGEYAGLRYEGLEEELQEAFLRYPVGVEQLINATDDDVLEVFARLNSYTVPLNAAELRHAKYQGDFKWKVREVATGLSEFWSRYEILSTRDRLRMLDDELTAEMFGVILEGVRDGGQPNINKLYSRYDRDFPQADEAAERLIGTVQFLDSRLSEPLEGDVFSRVPQVLMLFATIAHALYGIPAGDIRDEFPHGGPHHPIDIEILRANLAVLSQAVMDGEDADVYLDFVLPSLRSTQRIKSRTVRFQYLWRALSESL